MAGCRVWSGCLQLGFGNVELERHMGTSRIQLSLEIGSQERNLEIGG